MRNLNLCATARLVALLLISDQSCAKCGGQTVMTKHAVGVGDARQECERASASNRRD